MDAGLGCTPTIEDLILMSQDPAQLLQEMFFQRWVDMMLLDTDSDQEHLCNPFVRECIDDICVTLDEFRDRFGTDDHQKRVLPVHPNPGVRESQLPATTDGVREHINDRRYGGLGGMLYVGDIGCAIDGTEDDPDIGGDSSGDGEGDICNRTTADGERRHDDCSCITNSNSTSRGDDGRDSGGGYSGHDASRTVIAILQTEARAVAVVAAVAAALQTTTVIALVVTAT